VHAGCDWLCDWLEVRWQVMRSVVLPTTARSGVYCSDHNWSRQKGVVIVACGEHVGLGTHWHGSGVHVRHLPLPALHAAGGEHMVKEPSLF
jgi:hypothetical protein